MGPGRRDFLHLAAGGMAAGVLSSVPLGAQDQRLPPRFKAIAFDAFPIFDPRPVAALADSLFPGRGPALLAAWRTRQFEYQWLRALAGRHVDFLQATRDGLNFAARQIDLAMSRDQEEQLIAVWSSLPVWPDAAAAVEALRREGLRLAFLSNMTSAMLEGGLERAGLRQHFDAVISTDEVRSFKPDPRAYRLGVDRLKLRREEILFVAFAGWDVAGAKWFGYPTFWVNRANSPAEELGVGADGSGPDLGALVEFVRQERARRQ